MLGPDTRILKQKQQTWHYLANQRKAGTTDTAA